MVQQETKTIAILEMLDGETDGSIPVPSVNSTSFRSSIGSFAKSPIISGCRLQRIAKVKALHPA
jgi:hypothetical protein